MENTQKTIQMKKIGLKMNILMGVSLSFALSLSGLLLSGHFALIPWLISFERSTLLSFVIGFLIPIRKICSICCKKLSLEDRSIKALALDALISDIFYTPLITLMMVAFAYLGAKKEQAGASGAPQLSFLPMFFHSLVVSMIIGYVLIFILQPLFLRLLTRNLPKEGAE